MQRWEDSLQTISLYPRKFSEIKSATSNANKAWLNRVLRIEEEILIYQE